MIPIVVELFESESGGRRYIRGALGRFADFEPVMAGPVRRLVRKAIVAQFRTRGRFGNFPWEPLRKSTRDYKKAHSQWRQEPLRRTDDLYRSLVYRENAEEEITKDHYTLRTLVSYAKYHQSEEPRPSGLPRRPPIPDQLPEPMITELRKILRGYIITGEIAE
jgi:hypothetical protein